MNAFKFYMENPFKYIMTCKYESQDDYMLDEKIPMRGYELFVITKGKLHLHYHSETYEVSKGFFLLLPPVSDPEERIIDYQSSDCVYYWLNFNSEKPLYISDIQDEITKDYEDEFYHNTLLLPVQGIVPNSEKVIIVIKQLQDAVRSNYSSTALNYMSTVILCELHSQWYNYVKRNTDVHHLRKQIYFDIIDYIKKNTYHNLKVSDVAYYFGYNEKYLSNLFSSIVGASLKQFMLADKMDKANYLLTNTNKSVGDISIDLGYNDSHSFSKAYKKISGLTPSEYRNAYCKSLLY